VEENYSDCVILEVILNEQFKDAVSTSPFEVETLSRTPEERYAHAPVSTAGYAVCAKVVPISTVDLNQDLSRVSHRAVGLAVIASTQRKKR